LSGKNGSSSASRTGAAGSGRSPGSSSPSGMNAGGRQGALNRR
jgi:hypothetical protein